MFDSEKLNEKDKYQVFFGGNHAITQIVTDAGTGKCLLLFKDSYANSFVQFLYPYYDEIVMIDPRYYYDDVYQVIKLSNVTDVLFLYSADILFSDTSLADCLPARDNAAEEESETQESSGEETSETDEASEENEEDEE